MLSDKRYRIARQAGIAVATSNFVMHLNPKFRKPPFVWDNLYSIVDGFAKTEIGMIKDFGKDHRKMELVSAEMAKYELDRLFKESGVKDWLKL